MTNIQANDIRIKIGTELFPKNKYTVTLFDDYVRVKLMDSSKEINLRYEEVTIEETAAESNEQVYDYLDANSFKAGGGAPGEGVQEELTDGEIKLRYERNPNTNAYTDPEKTKLAGIQTEATKNDSDANLKNRANHTGTQLASTISDLPTFLDAKVDKVAGKDLSDANFTESEKNKLAALEGVHFKGIHIGLAGLQSAHPTAVAGDYAIVDDGVDLTWYQWDVSGSEWVARVGESAELTPAQVLTYYESNPDRYGFTGVYKGILDNIKDNNRFTFRRRGTWNAETNTPALLNGGGENGDYYVVTTPGTYNFGITDYEFGLYDWVFYEGGTWKRLAVNPQMPVLPESFKPRGSISPAIPSVRQIVPSTTAIPSNTTTIINNFSSGSSGYDVFGIKVDESYVMPSWASHIRVTATINVNTMNENAVLEVRVMRNGGIVARATTRGLGSSKFPATNIDTGIMASSPGDTFYIDVWHNNPSSVNLSPSLNFINIELFESI